MGVSCLISGAVLVGLVAAAVALQCYQCGQYNDGVGSITPCINETYMKLKECPSRDHAYCIKYISEGSTVRDCVPECTEREDWGTRTFCCREEGCNSAPAPTPPTWMWTFCGLLLSLVAMH